MPAARYHLKNLDRRERPFATSAIASAIDYWDMIVAAGGTPHCLESFEASHLPGGWSKPRSIQLGQHVQEIVLPIKLRRRG